MSKRFGRKQKRSFREQITKLEKKTYEQESKINQDRYIIGLIAEWDREIRRLLGEESALRFKTKLQLVDREDLPEYYRKMTYNTMPFTVALLEHPGQDTTIAIQNLSKIMTEIKYHPEDFRMAIRLVLQNKTVSAMYVDEQYLQRNGFTERDIEWLAGDIAKKLANYTNKEYGHDYN